MIGDAEFQAMLNESLIWDVEIEPNDEEDVNKLVDEVCGREDAVDAAERDIRAIEAGDQIEAGPVAHELYVAKLVDQARNMRAVNTKSALACTGLATEAASCILEANSRVRALKGNAWREHAETLSLLGKHSDAIGAVQRAEAELEDGENSYEASKLAITRGTVLRAVGRGLEEIFRVRGAAAFFKEIEDVEQYRNARMVEAMILYSDGRFDEMVFIYLALYNDLAAATASQADPADERKRLSTIALLSQHIGHGLRALGNYTDARVYLERADEMFTSLGHEANALRARWGLAKIQRATGEFDEALNLLASISRAFAEISYEVEAWLVSLDRAAIFHDIERWVECAAICKLLAREFTRVGMPKATREAIAYLRDCVEKRNATGESFDYVSSFISKARNDHGAVFVSPS